MNDDKYWSAARAIYHSQLKLGKIAEILERKDTRIEELIDIREELKDGISILQSSPEYKLIKHAQGLIELIQGHIQVLCEVNYRDE